MAFTDIANNAQNSGNGAGSTIAVAYPSDFGAGHLLVAAISYSSGASEVLPTSVTDGLSQTWTKAVNVYDTANQTGIAIYYKYNTGASASAPQRTVTADWGATTPAWRRITVSEFSGELTSADPLNKYASANVNYTSGTDHLATASVTPDVDGELFICASVMSNGAYVPYVAGTGFTELTHAPSGSGVAAYLQMEKFIQTTKAAHIGSWTTAGSDWSSVAVATFKPAGSGTDYVKIINE